MRVVLRDDIAGVGRRGDIVKVAGGFARNFLLPEGRAIVATEGVEGQAEQMRRGRDLRIGRPRKEGRRKKARNGQSSREERRPTCAHTRSAVPCARWHAR